MPTDFSENSADAIDYAVELALAFKAALHFVYVCQMPALATATMDGAIVSLPDWEMQFRSAAEAEMAKLVARIGCSQVPARSRSAGRLRASSLGRSSTGRTSS